MILLHLTRCMGIFYRKTGPFLCGGEDTSQNVLCEVEVIAEK